MRIRTVIGLAIALQLAGAHGAAAQTLTAPEAVGALFFPGYLTAMPKTVSASGVSYRGGAVPGDPERIFLSITASRADPCLFEAFYIEAPAPALNSAVAVVTAYVATVDVRKLDAASFRRASAPAGGAQLNLKGKNIYCMRSLVLEQTPKLTVNEGCVDSIDEAASADDVSRMSVAFDALGRACRW